MRAIAIICLTLAAFSQTRPPISAGNKTKSRELLETAETALGSAEVRVQIEAMLQMADAYSALDRKKTIELLDHAYAAAAVLPGGSLGRLRAHFQVDATRKMADLDLPKATEMLAGISAAEPGNYDPRVWAAVRLVEIHLEKKHLDEAAEVVSGLRGAYPFGAASLILTKLPQGDPRRITLFGDAAVAYEARPDREFIHLLAKHWRAVPRRMAESALDTAVRRTLESNDEGNEMVSISSEQESVTLKTASDADLFELLPVLRALEPARAEEILNSRRELKSMLQKHPEGSQSLKGSEQSMIKVGGIRRPGAPPPGAIEQAGAAGRLEVTAESIQRSMAALSAVKTDPQRAIGIANSIPTPAQRAQTLGSVAIVAAKSEPAVSRSALKDALALTSEMKEPGDRVGAWDNIAGAAHALGDDKLAAEALEKGLADAAELYKKDTDSDKPNPAPQNMWRSTDAFLRLIRRATQIMGPEADAILLKITDPNLNLLARIEIARALLRSR